MSSHLGVDAQICTCWLSIGENCYVLELLSRHTSTLETDGDVSTFSWLDTFLGIIGHRAPTGGIAAADYKVSIAFVDELEAVTDVLACRQLSKIVHILVEGYQRHLLTGVVATGTIGIMDNIGIQLFFVVAAGSQCHQQEEAKHSDDISNMIHVGG